MKETSRRYWTASTKLKSQAEDAEQQGYLQEVCCFRSKRETEAEYTEKSRYYRGLL
jgi:hypothetical protein